MIKHDLAVILSAILNLDNLYEQQSKNNAGNELLYIHILVGA